MKITKDNIRLLHDDGMWYAEIIIYVGVRPRNAWAWNESAKQAVLQATKQLRT